MRYFFSLKNKTENKQLPPSPAATLTAVYATVYSPFLKILPTSFQASLVLLLLLWLFLPHLLLGICPLPSALFSSPHLPPDLTQESGSHSWLPSFPPSWELDPRPLRCCWHWLSWILSGLCLDYFSGLLTGFPSCSLPVAGLLGSVIKPTPATVIFLESSAQATSLLKLLQGLPLVDKVESTLFEEGLQG